VYFVQGLFTLNSTKRDFLLNLKPNHLKRKTFLLSMTDVFRTSDFQKRQKQYFQVKKK